jgi:TolA-binding protein
MKSSSLAIFCLFLLMGFLSFYLSVGSKAMGAQELKIQNEKLQWSLKSQELKTILAHYELEDFRQNIAGMIPGDVKNNLLAAYQMRNLASIVKEPLNENLKIERASSLIAKAKKSFELKNYNESNKLFNSLIQDYPESIHAVEAYFLLIEGQYQIQDYENCISSVDDMLILYPENELTGFAMLRLGKIFESQDRVEDAAEIYKALLKDFKNSKLKEQARLNLKSVEL